MRGPGTDLSEYRAFPPRSRSRLMPQGVRRLREEYVEPTGPRRRTSTPVEEMYPFLHAGDIDNALYVLTQGSSQYNPAEYGYDFEFLRALADLIIGTSRQKGVGSVDPRLLDCLRELKYGGQAIPHMTDDDIMDHWGAHPMYWAVAVANLLFRLNGIKGWTPGTLWPILEEGFPYDVQI